MESTQKEHPSPAARAAQNWTDSSRVFPRGPAGQQRNDASSAALIG
jgi:hypothetical protein